MLGFGDGSNQQHGGLSVHPELRSVNMECVEWGGAQIGSSLPQGYRGDAAFDLQCFSCPSDNAAIH